MQSINNSFRSASQIQYSYILSHTLSEMRFEALTSILYNRVPNNDDRGTDCTTARYACKFHVCRSLEKLHAVLFLFFRKRNNDLMGLLIVHIRCGQVRSSCSFSVPLTVNLFSKHFYLNLVDINCFHCRLVIHFRHITIKF